MDFVNVLGSIPTKEVNKQLTLASINVTKKTLISIISGLKQKNFGYDTMQRTVRDFRQFKNNFAELVDGELYGDSGGYSIIGGDVNPKDIPKFVSCYNKFFQLEHGSVDQFFSLDIPVFLKPEFRDYNTCKHIFEFNHLALSESKKLLEQDPEFRGKFNFVWHFKILEQYLIWDRLYEELELSNLVSRRSIGGMVGLPKRAGIKFAPFIGLAFRCLYDHLNGPYSNEPFILHLLGIKSRSDRLAMAVLEKLFKAYLPESVDVIMTYDSINANRNTQFNVKNLETYSFENGTLNRYDNVFSLPQHVVESVYSEASMQSLFARELTQLKAGKNLTTADSFSPLGLYSVKAIDAFFIERIILYKVVDIFLESTSVIQVKYHLEKFLLDMSLEQPKIFTKIFKKTLIENIEWIFKFHYWHKNYRDKSSLDKLIIDFIDEINYPDKLQ